MTQSVFRFCSHRMFSIPFDILLANKIQCNSFDKTSNLILFQKDTTFDTVEDQIIMFLTEIFLNDTMFLGSVLIEC